MTAPTAPTGGAGGPQRTRTYRNHLLDSERWDDYVPREDDVVVATPYKSGTTWTLAIVRELFALDDPDLPPFTEMWVDCRFRESREDFARAIEAQTHRRYLKTHLALDGLPFFDEVRYIVVGRDPRDVFMSFWNHYRAMPIDALDRIPGRIGDPLPAPPDDVLTDAEFEPYDREADAILPPVCRAWLEGCGPAD